MSLFEQAAADNRGILGDAAGFSWPITVTDPSGNVYTIPGWPNDVSAAIDPETGQLVRGRTIEVVFSTAEIEGSIAGQQIPKGEPSKGERPWIVEWDDPQGDRHTFALVDVMPDAFLPMQRWILGFYKR